MEKNVKKLKALFMEELDALRTRNNIPSDFLAMLKESEEKLNKNGNEDYYESTAESMEIFQKVFSVSEKCAAKICAVSSELAEVCGDLPVAPLNIRLAMADYMDAISEEAGAVLDEISEHLDKEERDALHKMIGMYTIVSAQMSGTVGLGNTMLSTLLDLHRGKNGIEVIKANGNMFDFDDEEDDDWCDGCHNPCDSCEEKPEGCEDCPCYGCEGCGAENSECNDEVDEVCFRCEGCPGEEDLKESAPEILGDECEGCYGCNGCGDRRGYAEDYDESEDCADIEADGDLEDEEWEDVDDELEDDIVREGQMATYTTCVSANKRPKFDVELRIIPHEGYCLELSECDSIVKSILGQAAEKFDKKLLRTI